MVPVRATALVGDVGVDEGICQEHADGESIASIPYSRCLMCAGKHHRRDREALPLSSAHAGLKLVVDSVHEVIAAVAVSGSLFSRLREIAPPHRAGLEEPGTELRRVSTVQDALCTCAHARTPPQGVAAEGLRRSSVLITDISDAISVGVLLVKVPAPIR